MERIESTYSLKKEGKVTVRLSSADVFIKGTDGDQVKVAMIKRRPESAIPLIEATEEELIIKSGDKRTSGEFRREPNKGLGQGLWETIWDTVSSGLKEVGINLSLEKDEVDLELSLPRGIILDFFTVSGDLAVQDWEGELYFRSASGDCRLRNIKGRAKMRSSSGDIRVEGFEGPLSVNTTSGDIDMEEIKGDLKCETLSGDMELGRIQGNGNFSLISGDLR
ncbi:MAG: DUF4097 family beta strand repeat-containing protein, partial [bacterium]